MNHNLTFSWDGVTAVPPGADLHTLNVLGVRCCRLSLWTQILLHSLHSQSRSPAVRLLSVPSHCVVPPSMAFRGKRGSLCATMMCWHLWETMKTVGRMQHAILQKLSSNSKEKLLPAIWSLNSEKLSVLLYQRCIVRLWKVSAISNGNSVGHAKCVSGSNSKSCNHTKFNSILNK